MNREELLEVANGFGSYLEVLCKAVLLDKVTIVDGRIKVENWELPND